MRSINFNHHFMFMATRWKPNIKIWLFCLTFFNWKTQNHFVKKKNLLLLRKICKVRDVSGYYVVIVWWALLLLYIQPQKCSLIVYFIMLLPTNIKCFASLSLIHDNVAAISHVHFNAQFNCIGFPYIFQSMHTFVPTLCHCYDWLV